MPVAEDGQDTDETGSDTERAWSVSRLTREIDGALKQCLPEQVLVRGEISRWTWAASGHGYFTLKDDRCVVNGQMWRSRAGYLKFDPQDGDEVLITGRVEVYGPRGSYSLVADRIEPVGQGALDLAFQRLYAKLEAEGLFAPERKRPLPRYPRRIALVTSPQAAGYADICKVFGDFGFLKLFLYPVRVQGEGAATEIAAALRHLSNHHGELGGVDAILLARGGGSREDLWAFNEEPVARAVAASSVPVITGIGHEIDVSISDLVADYHAHTPTEAAQVLARPWREARDVLDRTGVVLRRDARRLVAELRQHVRATERHELFRRPLDRVERLRQLVDEGSEALSRAQSVRLDRLRTRLCQSELRLAALRPVERTAAARQELVRRQNDLRCAMELLVERQRARLGAATAQLAALDPQAVLRRGYTLTFTGEGTLVRRAGDVRPGQALVTRTSDGEIRSVAGEMTQGSLFEQ